jgi:hypothetical protein
VQAWRSFDVSAPTIEYSPNDVRIFPVHRHTRACTSLCDRKSNPLSSCTLNSPCTRETPNRDQFVYPTEKRQGDPSGEYFGEREERGRTSVRTKKETTPIQNEDIEPPSCGQTWTFPKRATARTRLWYRDKSRSERLCCGRVARDNNCFVS